MIKLKLSLLFAFVFLNATAQNQNLNSKVIESLKIEFDSIYDKMYEVSPKEFSELGHHFMNKLDSITKRIKQVKKKKNLKKEKIKVDLQKIQDIKANVMLCMMIYGYGIKDNIDSINYYRNKISLITNVKKTRGKSHGVTAHFLYKKQNFAKSINQYSKALEILGFPENKDLREYQISVLVNLISRLLDLNIIEIAEKNYKRLYETIMDMSDHKRYKNYIELLKIEESIILIAKKDYKNSLKVLKKIKENNLDRKSLKLRYLVNLSQTYLGLKEYKLGEFHFDEAHSKKYKDNNYYLDKLEYAVKNRNIEKADLYFSKIESDYDDSEDSKIVSDYFTLKKNDSKTIELLNLTLNLKESEAVKAIAGRFNILKFDNELSKELAEMKTLNKLKEQEIIDNKLLYTKIGVAVLFIIIIILTFVEWANRKKRYLDNLTQKSKRTILEAKEQFLENMSHEIRTPITSILGYLSLLKEESLISDKRLNYTNSAIDNTNKMMDSLDNFLNLTSLEGGSKFKNIETSINISNFIQKIKTTFTANLEIKKIKLFFKTNAEDNLIINFDIESLTIIVNNLISNAIKYSNSNTSIYLTLFFEESKLRLMVKDEGFGISENEKETIFSRFYQTKNNTSNSGFGIGLSLTNNLIKKLNGKISLETAVNVGSVFKVELPIVINNYNLNTTQIDQKFKEICTNQCIEPEINKNNNLPKALVVDDNTEMIIYLKEIFSDFLDCTFAFNGKEALGKIEEQSFEIIISDLKMPVMNGIEFKEALNEKATSKNIPFIFMSSVVKDKVEDFNLLSFEDYIEKPFRKDEMLSRIQFALEKTLNRKKLTQSTSTEINFESSSKDLIKKVKNCILENLTNPDFNVVKLCEVCGYGQKKLNEILKAKIGLSIVNTILEIRLLKAYDLIIKNRYETLKEVVYAVGMNSRPYFNKKFEMRFGIKPGELRKKYIY